MQKNLIILALAIVVLIGVLFVNRKEVEKTRTSSFALDSAQKVNVTQIRVLKQLDSIAISSEGGAWVVGDDGYPADTAKVNKVLGVIFGLEDRVMVSRNPERAEEYGMDSAAAKRLVLAGSKGGELADVTIGKTSGTDYNSTYWKWTSKPEVYRTPGNFAWEIPSETADWKQKDLFEIEKENIQSLQVSWVDTSGTTHDFTIEADTGSTWKMTAPQQGDADGDMASDMVERMADITIDAFIDTSDTNVTMAAIDSPTVVVKARLKAGKTHELRAGKTFDGYTYVKHPTRDMLVKVSEWRLDVFQKTVEELYKEPQPEPEAETEGVPGIDPVESNEPTGN